MQTIRFVCYDLDLNFLGFFKIFMPYSLYDQIRDNFDQLEWGFMTIFVYEAHFHELSKYFSTNTSIEFERTR